MVINFDSFEKLLHFNVFNFIVTGENDNTESQADIKQTIKREVDETEYHPWRRQHNKMCPASKSHHTIIPEREKGFRFHKFHGHTHSLKECNIRCCDRKECVLSFQIASTCYGVICDEAARSCHSTNDQLDQIKIYFTSLKGIPQSFCN